MGINGHLDITSERRMTSSRCEPYSRSAPPARRFVCLGRDISHSQVQCKSQSSRTSIAHEVVTRGGA